ncbi:MAG: hypothetical protein PHS37_01645 [Candidatus Omnitrophica bacterium]|nr:hypothetical protein [Candidatus Omnitrophota bacterium]
MKRSLHIKLLRVIMACLLASNGITPEPGQAQDRTLTRTTLSRWLVSDALKDSGITDPSKIGLEVVSGIFEIAGQKPPRVVNSTLMEQAHAAGIEKKIEFLDEVTRDDDATKARFYLAGHPETVYEVTLKKGMITVDKLPDAAAGVPSPDGTVKDLLREYTYDGNIRIPDNVVVVVKGRDQIRRNKVQLERFMREVKAQGRKEAKGYPSYGLLLVSDLKADKLSGSPTSNYTDAPEPNSVDMHGTRMAMASWDKVMLYDFMTGERQVLKNDWFANLHTVQFSPDGKRLLVASSGFDLIIEISLEPKTFGKELWSWCGWEHGYDTSDASKKFYTRDARYKGIDRLPDSRQVVYVGDPLRYQGYGIPAGERASNINDASYGKDGKILATMFHKGVVLAIDRKTNEAAIVYGGLRQPHGIRQNPRGGYYVTSTAGKYARVAFLDEQFRTVSTISLEGLPVTGLRKDFPAELEWLQYANWLTDDIFALTDIQRSAIHLVDVRRRAYRSISVPPEWSVQMVVPAPDFVSLTPDMIYRSPWAVPAFPLPPKIYTALDRVAGNNRLLTKHLANLLLAQEKRAEYASFVTPDAVHIARVTDNARALVRQPGISRAMIKSFCPENMDTREALDRIERIAIAASLLSGIGFAHPKMNITDARIFKENRIFAVEILEQLKPSLKSALDIDDNQFAMLEHAIFRRGVYAYGYGAEDPWTEVGWSDIEARFTKYGIAIPGRLREDIRAIKYETRPLTALLALADDTDIGSSRLRPWQKDPSLIRALGRVYSHPDVIKLYAEREGLEIRKLQLERLRQTYGTVADNESLAAQESALFSAINAHRKLFDAALRSAIENEVILSPDVKRSPYYNEIKRKVRAIQSTAFLWLAGSSFIDDTGIEDNRIRIVEDADYRYELGAGANEPYVRNFHVERLRSLVNQVNKELSLTGDDAIQLDIIKKRWNSAFYDFIAKNPKADLHAHHRMSADFDILFNDAVKNDAHSSPESVEYRKNIDIWLHQFSNGIDFNGIVALVRETLKGMVELAVPGPAARGLNADETVERIARMIETDASMTPLDANILRQYMHEYYALKTHIKHYLFGFQGGPLTQFAKFYRAVAALHTFSPEGEKNRMWKITQDVMDNSRQNGVAYIELRFNVLGPEKNDTLYKAAMIIDAYKKWARRQSPDGFIPEMKLILSIPKKRPAVEVSWDAKKAEYTAITKVIVAILEEARNHIDEPDYYSRQGVMADLRQLFPGFNVSPADMINYIAGIDAAGQEEQNPPEVFREAYQIIQEYNARTEELNRRNGTHFPLLDRTFHVSESATDVSAESAIRHSVEAIRIGSRRLGHNIFPSLPDFNIFRDTTREESVPERIQEIKFDISLLDEGVPLISVNKDALTEELDDLGYYLANKDLTGPDITARVTKIKAERHITGDTIRYVYDTDEKILDLRTRAGYALDLAIERGVVIESCPTSNMLVASPYIKTYKEHPIAVFLSYRYGDYYRQLAADLKKRVELLTSRREKEKAAGLAPVLAMADAAEKKADTFCAGAPDESARSIRFVIATDNTAILNTNLTEEYYRIAKAMRLDWQTVARIIENSINAPFNGHAVQNNNLQKIAEELRQQMQKRSDENVRFVYGNDGAYADITAGNLSALTGGRDLPEGVRNAAIKTRHIGINQGVEIRACQDMDNIRIQIPKNIPDAFFKAVAALKEASKKTGIKTVADFDRLTGSDGRTVVISEWAKSVAEEIGFLRKESWESLTEDLITLVRDLSLSGLRLRIPPDGDERGIADCIGRIDGRLAVTNIFALETAEPLKMHYEDAEHISERVIRDAVSRHPLARVADLERPFQRRRLFLRGGVLTQVGQMTYVAKEATRVSSEAQQARINVKPWAIFELVLTGRYAKNLIHLAQRETMRFERGANQKVWQQFRADVKALAAAKKADDKEAVARLRPVVEAQQEAIASGWKKLYDQNGRYDTGWAGPPRIILWPADEVAGLEGKAKDIADGMELANNCSATTIDGDRFFDTTGEFPTIDYLMEKIGREDKVRVSAGSLARIAVMVEGRKHYLYFMLQGKEKAFEKSGKVRYQPFGGHAYFTRRFLDEKRFEFDPEDKEQPKEMAGKMSGQEMADFLEFYYGQLKGRQFGYFIDPMEVLRKEILEELAGYGIDDNGGLIQLKAHDDFLQLVPPEIFDVLEAPAESGSEPSGADIVVPQYLRERPGYVTTVYKNPPLGTSRTSREGEHTLQVFEIFRTDLLRDEGEKLAASLAADKALKFLLVTKEFIEKATQGMLKKHRLSPEDGRFASGMIGKQVTIGDNCPLILEQPVSAALERKRLETELTSLPDVPDIRVSASCLFQVTTRLAGTDYYLVAYNPDKGAITAIADNYHFDGDNGRLIYSLSGLTLEPEDPSRPFVMRQRIPNRQLQQFLRLFHLGIGREISPMRGLRDELSVSPAVASTDFINAPLYMSSFDRYLTPELVASTIIDELRRKDAPVNIRLIDKACKLAIELHASARDALRDDQRPYAFHPLEMALFMITDLGITDQDAILTAILHDVPEDTFVIPGGRSPDRAEIKTFLETHGLIKVDGNDRLTDYLIDMTEKKEMRPVEGRLAMKLEHTRRVINNYDLRASWDNRIAPVIVKIVDRCHNILSNEGAEKKRYMEKEEALQFRKLCDLPGVPGSLKRFASVLLEQALPQKTTGFLFNDRSLSAGNREGKNLLAESVKALAGRPVNMRIDLSCIRSDTLSEQSYEAQVEQNLTTIARLIAAHNAYKLDVRYSLENGPARAVAILKDKLMELGKLPGVDIAELLSRVGALHTGDDAITVSIRDVANLDKGLELGPREYVVGLKDDASIPGVSIPNYTAASSIGLSLAALRILHDKKEPGEEYTLAKKKIFETMSSIYKRYGAIKKAGDFTPDDLDFMVWGCSANKLKYTVLYALGPIAKDAVENLEQYHNAIQGMLQAA